MDLKSLAQNLAHSESLLGIYDYYHPTTTMTTTSQWETQHAGTPVLSSPSLYSQSSKNSSLLHR